MLSPAGCGASEEGKEPTGIEEAEVPTFMFGPGFPSGDSATYVKLGRLGAASSRAALSSLSSKPYESGLWRGEAGLMLTAGAARSLARKLVPEAEGEATITVEAVIARPLGPELLA